MRDGRTGRFASGFEKGSAGSYPATTSSISRASGTPFAKTVMQSRVRHAGTSPAVLQRPLLGLKPSRWLKAAGTRPEPAVSVPSATGTSPAANAIAEPALEPPPRKDRLKALRGRPYGRRGPPRPGGE